MVLTLKWTLCLAVYEMTTAFNTATAKCFCFALFGTCFRVDCCSRCGNQLFHTGLDWSKLSNSLTGCLEHALNRGNNAFSAARCEYAASGLDVTNSVPAFLWGTGPIPHTINWNCFGRYWERPPQNYGFIYHVTNSVLCLVFVLVVR
jgi:hypothetical protein